MKAIGYGDRLSALPGDRVSIKVRSEAETYNARLVELRSANPPGAQDSWERIPSNFEGDYPGRWQDTAIGSYIRVDSYAGPSPSHDFTVAAWFEVALLEREAGQAIVSGAHFWIGIDELGRIAFEVSGEQIASVRTSEPLMRGEWLFIAARFGAESEIANLSCWRLARSWLPEVQLDTEIGDPRFFDDRQRQLLIGAGQLRDIEGGRVAPLQCFNGKVDRPSIWSRGLTDDEIDGVKSGIPATQFSGGLEASWDFSRDPWSDNAIDVSGRGQHGTCVNMPMRGVVGANWDGSETSFTACPGHYGAIAFHEDDLEDCEWESDFDFEIPDDLSSGLYGVELQAEDSKDIVPVYVRPPTGKPTADILFLAPTFTYLAYANERLYDGIATGAEFIEKSTDHEIELGEWEAYMAAHPELGSSVYDVHPDGSGVCYSSRLRPVMTMRHGWVNWLSGGIRHFSADLYLIEWLDSIGYRHDIATDDDLHFDGRELLDGYKVIVTGGHPEYWTGQMLDALEEYLADGGKLMYLGGNGFYWVTGVHNDRPHVVEIRRGINGTRAWSSHPGETRLSSTGEPGGLWRYRGRPPNALVGVGFASEGWGGAPGYTVLPRGQESDVAFVFEGFDDSEVIGEFGYVMGGAAGDEIDRFDHSLGTPPESIRLATTEGKHTDYYQLVIEDCTFMLPGHGGTEDPGVRSDLTLTSVPGGGSVFSVGSINWIGSLMWNNADNNVSQVTKNVLDEFLNR